MVAAALAVLENEEQRNELAALYKENLNRFLNVALSKLHNRQDAEDAVQQAFLRLVEKPERFFFIPVQARVQYVYIIVKNVSIEMFNKKNKVSIEKLDEENPYNENSISLEDNVVGKLSKDKLKRFIKTLPPLQRDVLTLRCFIGLSISDTAEALNISVPAVKERLRLARKAIYEFVINGGQAK